MTRFRRKSAAPNLVRIIPVWHTDLPILAEQSGPGKISGAEPGSYYSCLAWMQPVLEVTAVVLHSAPVFRRRRAEKSKFRQDERLWAQMTLKSPPEK